MEQSPSEALLASSPPKKKRGRPKKAEKLPLPQNDASPAIPKGRRKRKKLGFSKPVPVASGRKRRQQGMSPPSTKMSDSDAEDDTTGPVLEKDESTGPDFNVGQPVHGVVDGMFDAGYLVTVRVGDTDTMFRGVVFGPGLSLPLNTENDVAPKLKKMNHDDDTGHDVYVAPSSGAALNQAQAEAEAEDPVTSPASTPAAVLHGPVNSAPTLAPPAVLPAGEGHRGATIAGSMTGVPTNMIPGQPQAPVPSARSSAGYSPVAPYRSPLFVQRPLPNAPGGFYYAARNPNGNHGPTPYFPPPNFSGGAYAFQYPAGADQYHAGSSQFAAPAPAAASPSPNMQGTLPPRA